jgi:hypothetical protein
VGTGRPRIPVSEDDRLALPQIPALGFTEDELVRNFENPDLGTTLTPPDRNGIRYAVNGKGDVVAAFERRPDGTWTTVIDGLDGGGSGGGGGGGLSARDLQQAGQFDRSLSEDARQFDLSTAEGRRQFDESLAQRGLETALSEGRLNRADVGDLGLGLGRLNLDQQQFIAEILRNPADFLARAFTQRGGESPFPEISQADLINRLGSEFDRIRNFTGEQLAGNSRLLGGGGARAPLKPRIQVQPPGSAPFFGQVPGGDFFSSGNEALDQTLSEVSQNPLDNSRTFTPSDRIDVSDITGGRTDLTGAAAALAQLAETARGEQQAGRFEHGTEGPVRSRISLVGEAGPELLINHKDGSFDVVSNDDLQQITGAKHGTLDVEGYQSGTLEGLTPDDLGRLSLFDVAAVPQTSQPQIEQFAQLSTPPGPANLLGGRGIPDLDVTAGSDFQLFSPQQFAELTRDEQRATSTRLASQNKSLEDFLFASNRFFGGRPRQRPRARIDVTR